MIYADVLRDVPKNSFGHCRSVCMRQRDVGNIHHMSQGGTSDILEPIWDDPSNCIAGRLLKRSIHYKTYELHTICLDIRTNELQIQVSTGDSGNALKNQRLCPKTRPLSS